MFLVQKMVTKNTKKIWTTGLPPLIEDFFLNFTNYFFGGFPKGMPDNSQRASRRKQCNKLSCLRLSRLENYKVRHTWKQDLVPKMALLRAKSEFIHDGKPLRKVPKSWTRILAPSSLALGRAAICVNLKLPQNPSPS